MNLQEHIRKILREELINETKFFRRRIQPAEVASYFMLFAERVFLETSNYKQFRYELVLESLEHIMWQDYGMSWEDLPEQEEIDYINNVAEMYDEVIRAIYDRYYNR